LPAEDLGQDVEPRLGAEPEIEEHDVEAAALERLERAARRPHAEHARVAGLETEAQGLADPGVVIDDERGPVGRGRALHTEDGSVSTTRAMR